MANEEREHIDSQFCWCHPYIHSVVENGGIVWVHRAPDGEKPPPEILAEAEALARLQGGDTP